MKNICKSCASYNFTLDVCTTFNIIPFQDICEEYDDLNDYNEKDLTVYRMCQQITTFFYAKERNEINVQY